MTVLGLVKSFIKTGVFGDLIVIILLVFAMAVIVGLMMAADPLPRPYMNGMRNRLRRAFAGRPTKPRHRVRVKPKTADQPKTVPIKCRKAYFARPMKKTLLKVDGTPVTEDVAQLDDHIKKAYYGRSSKPALMLEKKEATHQNVKKRCETVQKVYGLRKRFSKLKPLPIIKKLED